MPKKDQNRDSNTDLFLKLMKKKKQENKPEVKQKEEIDAFSSASKKFIIAMNSINAFLDKILSTKTAIKILSLVLSVLLVFTISGGNISNVFTTPTSGDIISNVPVVVDGLSKDYVVTGVPDSVSVMMVGSSLDIYSVKASNSIEVYIDVKTLAIGEHTVELKARNYPIGLEIVVQPGTSSINIASKQTQTFPLTHRFNNLDKMDEIYSISLESVEFENVEVRGSQAVLEQVNSVEVNIDVSGVTSSFEQDALIFAYDRSGNVLPVEITPAFAVVKCDVTSYSKDVSLIARIQGDLNDMAIKDVVFDYDVVTIYGRQENISNINELYVDVDANLITGDVELSDLNIKLVDGINKISMSTVDVKIYVDESVSKVIEGISYNVVNNSEKYKISSEIDKISIKVFGAKSIVDSIDEMDITATIDIKGLDVGEHEVTIVITLHNPYLMYEYVSSSSIIIKIEN